MKQFTRFRFSSICLLLVSLSGIIQAAQTEKPNILFIVSDDTGYGDLGPYGGGVGRGMPTPSIDELAAAGTTFFHSMPSPVAPRAAQPCKPGAFPTAAA